MGGCRASEESGNQKVYVTFSPRLNGEASLRAARVAMPPTLCDSLLRSLQPKCSAKAFWLFCKLADQEFTDSWCLKWA